MFAAHDQENLVHTHQTSAAAKSLAAGSKGLGARTPNNKAQKTPFKAPLIDENTFRGGKSALQITGKGNENLITTAKKGGAVDKNTFVTPAGPRNRAPLGMKTTNVKTKAFLTPAPLMAEPASAKTQIKSKSPRLRRPKVKVHREPDEDAIKDDEEEPEIEYMPPREEPLPDHPEDFPPDLNLSMFEGPNFSRGVYSNYLDPEDENGFTKFEREEAEKAAEASKNADELLERACEVTFQESLNDLQELRGELCSSNRGMIAGHAPKSNKKHDAPLTSIPAKRAPATISSKSAAAALSSIGETAPRSTLPAGDPKRRLKKSDASTKPAVAAMSNANTHIHAVATAAAKSTLGYSHGRAISTSLRPALSHSSQGFSHHRAASTMSAKCPNIAPKRSIASSTKVGHAHNLFSGARPQPRFHTKENKENDVKSSYQEETELIKKLQMQTLGGDEDTNEADGLMGAFSSDRLLLGADAFEEFRFEIPEL